MISICFNLTHIFTINKLKSSLQVLKLSQSKLKFCVITVLYSYNHKSYKNTLPTSVHGKQPLVTINQVDGAHCRSTLNNGTSPALGANDSTHGRVIERIDGPHPSRDHTWTPLPAQYFMLESDRSA